MKEPNLLLPRIETAVPKTEKGLATFTRNLLRMPTGSEIEIVFSSKDRDPISGALMMADIISALGHKPIAHITARGLRQGQLEPYVAQLAERGVSEALVVGGDPNPSLGPYHESYQVLEAIVAHNKNSTHKFEKIGLAGHPDGNEYATVADLRRKIVYLIENGIKSHIQTQPVADSKRVIKYDRELQKEGIDAPILAGVFGPGTANDYLALTRMVGVRKSLRFLFTNPQVLAAAALDTTYAQTPTPLKGLIKEALTKLDYGPKSLVDGFNTHPQIAKTHIKGVYLFSLKNFGRSVDFYLENSRESHITA